MTVAAYDNPDTMQREAWQDGKVIASVSAALLCTKGFKGDAMFFGLNVGPWSTGQLVGDRAALHEPATEEGRRRYPPDGIYADATDPIDYEPCTCTHGCSDPCKGQCGCAACRTAYGDFLSNE